MSILLLGVGADSTNASPTPPVYADGSFEYIPIPEAAGPEGTAESMTFGTYSLRCSGGTLADFLDYIRPGGTGGDRITGDRLQSWPLHHDPNFAALTYGESISRPAYVRKIRQLEPGDIVAFYTGLKGEDSPFRHRYLIGYFTVDHVVDFQSLDIGGVDRPFRDLSETRQRALMSQYEDNAHVKRYFATGSLHARNDGVVLIDGRQPGTLLDRAYRISEHSGGGHHYLRGSLQQYRPETETEDQAYLGGIKQAHFLDMSSQTFRALVTQEPME